MRRVVWLSVVVLGLALGPAAHSASPRLLDEGSAKVAIDRVREPSPPFCAMHDDPCRKRKVNICLMVKCERSRPTFCFMKEQRCGTRARVARRVRDRAAWAHHLEKAIHGFEVQGPP